MKKKIMTWLFAALFIVQIIPCTPVLAGTVNTNLARLSGVSATIARLSPSASGANAVRMFDGVKGVEAGDASTSNENILYSSVSQYSEFTYDLGEVYPIDKFIAYSVNKATNYCNGFTVTTSLSSNFADSNTYTYQGTVSAAGATVTFEKHNARYVKFNSTSYEKTSGNVYYSEFEVYGDVITPEITVVKNTGGSVSPDGTISLSVGESQPFTITPDEGYYIKSVKFDGVEKMTNQLGVQIYTAENVTVSAVLEVRFALISEGMSVNLTRNANVSATFSNLSPNGTPPGSNAVRMFDGIKTGDAGAASISNDKILYSAATAYPTFTYDLGANYLVDKAVIYTVTGASNYCNGFNIYTSTTKDFSNPQVFSYSGIIPNIGAMVEFERHTARYVKFESTSHTATGGYVYYSEFEVYGTEVQREYDVQVNEFLLEEDGATLSILNYYDSETPAAVIVATYLGNQLSEVFLDETYLVKQEYYFNKLDFTKEYDSAKLMVWNGKNNMIPLCPAIYGTAPEPLPEPPEEESTSNLALNAPVSTNFKYSTVDAAVEYVTDGDPSTRIKVNAGKEQTNGWFVIDLGTAANFNRVRITDYNKRIKSFEVLYSDHNTDWVQVGSGGKIQGDVVVDFDLVTARYVKLNISDCDKGISISEIGVYNTSDQEDFPNGKPERTVYPTIAAPVELSQPPTDAENFHVYLLIGQSNMNGRDIVPAEEVKILDRVYLFNANDKWEKAQPAKVSISKSFSNYMQGYNRYSSVVDHTTEAIDGLNLGSSFARALENQVDKDVSIGIISNARGGTSIAQWSKGSSYTYDLYEEAVRRTRAAMDLGATLKGIIWLQGEGEANTSNYLGKLNNFATNLRTELGVTAEEVPFIASMNPPKYTVNNERIQLIGDYIDNSDWISSADTATIDDVHFTSEAQHIIGIRMAVKVLSKVYGINIDEDTLNQAAYGNDLNIYKQAEQ